jgi:cytochrome c
MNDRFTTIAGWVLFAGIVALGSSLVAGEVFKEERPEKMGYPIEGVVVEGADAAAAEKPIEFYLASADPTKGEQVFKKCAACRSPRPRSRSRSPGRRMRRSPGPGPATAR